MAAEKDPLDFLESEELLRFFHYNKTEMSCMENPQIFLSQLRDHDLISEDRYKMVSPLKHKEIIKRAILALLDQIEKEQSQRIHVFWRCVFKKIIMDQYPTLQQLHKDLTDGSFHVNTQWPERVEKQETIRNKRECGSGTMSVDGEEQPGPSSQLIPVKRKFSSPLNHGLKAGVRPDTNRSQLPVTCGDLKGTLDKDKQAKGEKCILFNNRWFVPPEFEKRAGSKSKNWKMSIRSNGIPLGKLIEAGELRLQSYRRGCKRKSRAKKSQVQVSGCGPYTKRIQEKTVTILHHGNQKK